MNLQTPLVSISVVTYQHKNYIKQCLDGILMQQTTFSFEIILGEDESKDGTREICIDYANKYPDKIKLFLRNRNNVIYINGNATGRYNFIENLKSTKGKYIALCEGDDYWTDPLKLQKQVDFLEANPDFVICFHKVKVLTKTEGLVDDFITEDRFNKIKEFPITQKSLFDYSNFIHTPSVMFRNIIKDYPLEFELSPIGDYLLYFVLTNNGYIHRIENVMAVYRYGNGIYSKLIDKEKNKIGLKFQICLLSYTNSDYIKKRIIKNLYNKINYNEKKNVDNLTTKKLLKLIIKRIKKYF